MIRKYSVLIGIIYLTIILPTVKSICCSNVNTGLSLKCYICDNSVNPACGIFFKAYQFGAKHCGPNSKCALQRQPAQSDGWIGVKRVCYHVGTLKLNDSNGCRNWTDDNYTALYCFCDTDYCNGASTCNFIKFILISVTVALLIIRNGFSN